MSWFNKKPKKDGASDETLLQSYRAGGDLEYLGQLFDRYIPLIFGVCLKYLHDEEACKDAVMQIFEELTEKAKAFEIKNFKSWLYMLTRNYCLMQIRATGRVNFASLETLAESVPEPVPDDEDKEVYLNALTDCMQSLNLSQQQCLDLFYLKEKTYKEITDHTGFTLNEVKSFIQNGKRNLKICMERKHGK